MTKFNMNLVTPICQNVIQLVVGANYQGHAIFAEIESFKPTGDSVNSYVKRYFYRDADGNEVELAYRKKATQLTKDGIVWEYSTASGSKTKLVTGQNGRFICLN